MLQNGVQRWKCYLNTCKCFFKLSSTLDIIDKCNVHNHEKCDDKVLNRQKLSNSIKRKAQDDISTRPSKLIRSELKNNDIPSINTNDLKLIRNNNHYARKVLYSKLPKSMQETQNCLSSMNITTNKDEQFLFCNNLVDNIIGFSTETNLKALCDVTKVYMDGTFKSCTKYFLQLFTIHGFRNGLYVPLVFLVLPNKTLETYTKVFKYIVSYCTSLQLNFQPADIFVDFEVAIRTSVKFGGEKFNSLGYQRRIKVPITIYVSDYLKCVFGLPFLKPEEVFDCFIDDLMTIKPINATVDQFCDYLLKTYTEEDALFPPNIWAEFAATTNRTTNSCESYHAKLNASISAAHPNIFVLIEILLGIQSEIYVSLRSSATQPNKKTAEKKKFLREKMLSFTSGELNRFNFVKEVSFKFIP
ncbi:hypothetical protein AGLY_009532 [Aphis glycines]|uniref:MULE transposase domain-containing protein n=1 Tax=Aphis glycines TaxID=307491 RepID=A0A6G0TJW6_APHGL|nr:hypothetical protein AGLY_009532 [Aphis glycines]